MGSFIAKMVRGKAFQKGGESQGLKSTEVKEKKLKMSEHCLQAKKK